MIEIEVTRAGLRQAGFFLGLVLLALVGWRASSRGEDGRPRLLLPEVRAVETYRREAAGWLAEWETLDRVMNDMLADSETDLLSLGRSAERHFERAVFLAKSVDSTEAPSAMFGLEEQVERAAMGYVDAAVAAARWVSAPTEANRTDALEALAEAQAALEKLRGNAWMAGNDS